MSRGRHRNRRPDIHAARRRRFTDAPEHIVAERVCADCARPLTDHPKCNACGRYLWCCDQKEIAPGAIRHRGGCRR